MKIIHRILGIPHVQDKPNQVHRSQGLSLDAWCCQKNIYQEAQRVRCHVHPPKHVAGLWQVSGRFQVFVLPILPYPQQLIIGIMRPLASEWFLHGFYHPFLQKHWAGKPRNISHSESLHNWRWCNIFLSRLARIEQPAMSRYHRLPHRHVPSAWHMSAGVAKVAICPLHPPCAACFFFENLEPWPPKNGEIYYAWYSLR